MDVSYPSQLNLGLLILRLCLGLFLAYHGYNKVFGPGGLAGTSGWFASMGMKWPKWQARLAASTEIGAGLMLACGLLTPLAAAGVIGIMVVAIYTAHGKVGFFIFKQTVTPNKQTRQLLALLNLVSRPH